MSFNIPNEIKILNNLPSDKTYSSKQKQKIYKPLINDYHLPANYIIHLAHLFKLIRKEFTSHVYYPEHNIILKMHLTGINTYSKYISLLKQKDMTGNPVIDLNTLFKTEDKTKEININNVKYEDIGTIDVGIINRDYIKAEMIVKQIPVSKATGHDYNTVDKNFVKHIAKYYSDMKTDIDSDIDDEISGEVSGEVDSGEVSGEVDSGEISDERTREDHEGSIDSKETIEFLDRPRPTGEIIREREKLSTTRIPDARRFTEKPSSMGTRSDMQRESRQRRRDSRIKTSEELLAEQTTRQDQKEIERLRQEQEQLKQELEKQTMRSSSKRRGRTDADRVETEEDRTLRSKKQRDARNASNASNASNMHGNERKSKKRKGLLGLGFFGLGGKRKSKTIKKIKRKL
jgi:hypothetical protein